MKKLVCAVFFSSLLTSFSAQAQNWQSRNETFSPTFFAGAEISASKVKPNHASKEIVEDTYNFFGFNAGVRLNKWFSVSAFFQQSDTTEITAGDITGTFESALDFSAWGAEAAFYIPAGRYADFFVTAGGGYYSAKLEEEFRAASSGIDIEISKTKDSFFGARVGGGVEFKFNDSLSVLAAGRYVIFNEKKETVRLKNMSEFSLGVRIYF